MVVQCAAVVSSLLWLHLNQEVYWLKIATISLVWAAVVITILSGADYVIQAIQLSKAAAKSE